MRIKFLNYNVDNLNFDETIDKIVSLINSGKTNQHVVLNASKIVLMENNKELARIINSCDLINADGMSIIWASKFLGNKIRERVAGIDIMYKLLEVAKQNKYRVFLFGSEENVINSVVKKLKENYKGLIIAGYRNGFFKEEDEPNIIDEISKSNCHILFIGFSSPKKEFFLNKHKKKIKVPFCMGVGGSFDVIAGKYSRAPVWMQNIGLEWFYRFIQEPRRMWKRYFINNFKFIFIVLRFKLFKR